MSGNYQFFFDKLDKKSIKKLRSYKIKSKISIYQAEKKIEELQRNVIQKTTISVFFDNGVKEFEIEGIVIEPASNKVKLLDIIQSQLVNVKTPEIDGNQVYMEINRQFNEELKKKMSSSSLKVKEIR